MGKRLTSVGLDVGTTSTQLVVSELTVENRASGFAVPEMDITNRRIRYESPVYFTPLRGNALVDGEGLRKIVLQEYEAAGLTREQVDTGAIIVTGETSRKENARAVSQALSDLAGDFVVATAGPDLESVLAAKGSGAVDYSAETGKTVLHVDIGGGTSNLALIQAGKIRKTGCLNVGGRLLKFNSAGVVTYVSPVLTGLTDIRLGDSPSLSKLRTLADTLVQALEMAAGLREAGPLLEKLSTEEAGAVFRISQDVTLSFSGGVAACIQKSHPPLEFGDMGPILGQAIRESRLCRAPYRLAENAIRATVIGAGCHSAQLSGSTVFYQNIPFPLKNLPVCRPGEPAGDGLTVLHLPGSVEGYGAVSALAEGLEEREMLLVSLEADAAKALGQKLALRFGKDKPIFCMDGVRLPPGSYLDVGQPLGPALPVVVKTLIWKEGRSGE